MQLISKFNKGFRFLLCVNDIFSKCDCVVPLKDKKGISIVNAFQKILKEKSCVYCIVIMNDGGDGIGGGWLICIRVWVGGQGVNIVS